MSQAKIKQQIKSKFGSLSKFCRLANVDRYELNAVLTAKNPDTQRLRIISDTVRLTPKKSKDPKEIPKDFKTLVLIEVRRCGSIPNFIYEYPQLRGRASSIHRCIQGRYKRVTPFIKQLAETLKIEL